MGASRSSKDVLIHTLFFFTPFTAKRFSVTRHFGTVSSPVTDTRFGSGRWQTPHPCAVEPPRLGLRCDVRTRPIPAAAPCRPGPAVRPCPVWRRGQPRARSDLGPSPLRLLVLSLQVSLSSFGHRLPGARVRSVGAWFNCPEPQLWRVGIQDPCDLRPS